MEIAIVIALIGVACSIIIATNNLFGLKNRARAYLRHKLEIPTEVERLNSQHLASDRALFDQIRQTLPSEYPMATIRDKDFGATFRTDMTNGLRGFAWESRKPEFEFHDSELEAARVDLQSKVNAFLDPIGEYTFRVKGNPEFAHVPSDWRHRHPDKHRKAVGELNRAADELYESYSRLIRLGRKKLGDSAPAV